MNFKDLVNKKILFAFLIFNLFGAIFAIITYLNDIIYHIERGLYIQILFFIVSFWLFFLAFFFVLFLLLDLRVPEFFAGFAFLYCFVIGFGCVIFYPLFMIFIKGFSWYHLWNVFAHGFVGLQSLLFLNYIKRMKIFYLFIFGLIFVVKHLFDWFLGGFLYLLKFSFPFWFVWFLSFTYLGLLFLGFYLLSEKSKVYF